MQKFYTRTEAARILNLSGRTVWTKLKSGEIKGQQNAHDGRWYISAEELAKYMGLSAEDLNKSERPAEIITRWLIKRDRGGELIKEHYTPTYREILAQNGKGYKSAQDGARAELAKAVTNELETATAEELAPLYEELAKAVIADLNPDDVARVMLEAANR